MRLALWAFNCLPKLYVLRFFRNLFLILAGTRLQPLAAYFAGTIQVEKPRKLKFGKGAFINLDLIVEGTGEVQFGESVNIGPRVTITTTNHWAKGLEIKPVYIGDRVWVGAGAVLTPGSTVGAGSVIGAGSVVVGSIPPCEVWAGNPARKIRSVESAR